MNAKTLKALKSSIAHWERVVKNGLNEPLGRHECALCRLFYSPRALGKFNCEGCPVMEKTGEEFCEGSPYQSVADVYDDMVEHSELRKDERYIKQLKERAEQELAFLKSLLPT